MATVREPNSLPLQPRTPETEDEQSERERMHTVAGHMTGAQRRPRYGQPFYPVTIFGSAMYILATMVALIILSLIHPADSFATLGASNQAVGPADPINHVKYNPRPEWYFLFLFQLLKYFQGNWEIVGTAVIPGIATVILLGLPFYDRNWSRRAVRRPIAMGAAVLALLGIVFLTYTPISSSAALNAGSNDYLAAVAAHPKYVNIQAIFAKNCQPCHVGNGPYLGGLNLGDYAGLMKGGLGKANGYACLPTKVVIPGNAKKSMIWQITTWVQPKCAGPNMPLGNAQISLTDRTNLANWINDGAKGSTTGS